MILGGGVAGEVKQRHNKPLRSGVGSIRPDMALALQLQSSFDGAAFPCDWECMDDECLDGADARTVGVVAA